MAKLPIFKDKTDNCIWRKYRNLMINRTQEQIKQMMPGGEKKGLFAKILKFKQSIESKKSSGKRSTTYRTKQEQNYQERIRKMEEDALSESIPYIIYNDEHN